MSRNEPIIDVRDLSKSYGKIRAVKNISFYVERGDLFAFLGPNGAGKSTTIDIMCTVLKADAGSVMISGYKLGADNDAIRRSIGVVFQNSVLDERLTVLENLKCRASLYGLNRFEVLDRVANAVELTDLSDIASRLYGQLSGGQRRRVDIARALLSSPKVLFLDEPTTGLDPQTRKNIWDSVLRMKEEMQTTVFLTTHYMEEASKADYVVIIDNGIISAQGRPAYLREHYASDKLIMLPEQLGELLKILENEGVEFSLSGGQVIVSLERTIDAIPVLNMCKNFISSFEVVSGTMDEAFINITGKEIRE